MFNVTYLNPLNGKRALLIDNVDQEQAEAVKAKFGNPADAAHYLPEVEIESACLKPWVGACPHTTANMACRQCRTKHGANYDQRAA
ncbi:hypothetical protein [Cupriavidus sp. TMH.W2]|uniref:hypothetical protein n=1 Tax=Cupriavidus sp. TMH.W2 TaxID=3434465 RepID=UPI003D77A848